jgi:hypothetical protein
VPFAREFSIELTIKGSAQCRGSNQNQPAMVELKPATFFV